MNTNKQIKKTIYSPSHACRNCLFFVNDLGHPLLGRCTLSGQVIEAFHSCKQYVARVRLRPDV
jgi:hypothetical protein